MIIIIIIIIIIMVIIISGTRREAGHASGTGQPGGWGGLQASRLPRTRHRRAEAVGRASLPEKGVEARFG